MLTWALEDNVWIDLYLQNERVKLRPLAEKIVTSLIKGQEGVYPEDAEVSGRYAQAHVPLRLDRVSAKLDFVMDFLLSYYRSGMWVRWYPAGDFWIIECGEEFS